MAAFTLDTSGVITIPSGPYAGDWTWERVASEGGGLFTQGYVEALFASAAEARWPDLVKLFGAKTVNATWGAAFSDLSPEALALILRDCERIAWAYTARDEFEGATAWRDRAAGRLEDFPPQTPYLNDAGKVCLRETA